MGRGRRRGCARQRRSRCAASSSAASASCSVRAFDEEVGVLVDPGVIGRDVVRHEIEHQPQIALAQPLAQARERRVAAKVRVDVVVAAPQTASRRRLRRRKSGRTRRYSASRSAFVAETSRAAGPVCHTPRNQTMSKPCAGQRVELERQECRRASRCGRGPALTPTSEDRTRVLIWKSDG